MDTVTGPAPVGLTTQEADTRRRRGEANADTGGGTASYARILRAQVFNFYNNILFVIGVALLITTVLPALVVWFGLLTAAYRWRVLDRLLGVDALRNRTIQT